MLVCQPINLHAFFGLRAVFLTGGVEDAEDGKKS